MTVRPRPTQRPDNDDSPAAREGRFDALLIESTRISEPLPVAETAAAIRAALDACLLTDQEMLVGPGVWKRTLTGAVSSA